MHDQVSLADLADNRHRVCARLISRRVAASVPARRAASTDPLATLRTQ
jgi:ABC-type lipoprotein release transport system permease subunit